MNTSTGTVTNVSGTQTIRANWSVNSYTVTFNGNGGSCTPSSESVNYGGNSSTPSCSRTGYHVNSFSRTAGSGGTLNTSTGQVTSVTGSQTIAPTWSINQYTVTFDGNGGTCTPSSEPINYGSDSSIPSCTREGYHVVSYSRTAGSGGTLNTTSGQVTSVTGTQTVAPTWEVSNQAPTSPTNLLAEGQTNPTNILNVRPEFSAIYDDPDTSDTSSYYAIEVNTSSNFTGTVMWSSGKTAMTMINEGTRSQNIVYNGTTLTYNGQTYYWRIKFWDNSDVEGAWSATASFNMAVPTSSFYEVEVNTSSDFTGTVMWDTGKTAMTTITAGERTPNIPYGGTTLKQGVTYYWRIRFWDMNDNVSAWSDPATFSIDLPPTAQEPTPTSPTSITWNFIDNSQDELGFKVYDTLDVLKVTCNTPNISSCLETGLTENTSYSRKFTAYNSEGSSSYSDVVSTYTKASPVSILSYESTPDSITLLSGTFNNPTLGDSGYYFDCTSASCDTGINQWIQTETDTATGLLNNTNYNFRVKNRNANGVENVYSAEHEVWTRAAVPVISSLDVTDSTVTLQGSGVNNLALGSSGFYFDCITEANCNGGINEWITTESDTVVGLDSNTQYSFKLKARNHEGVETAYSNNTVTIYTEASQPAISSVSNPTTSSLQVAINSNGNSPTTLYLVEEVNSAKYISASGGLVVDPIWLTHNQLGSLSGITVTGLSSNTEYTFRVKAKNQSDVETSYSSPVSAYTQLVAPTALTPTTKTDTSITWKLSTTETGYDGIKVYDTGNNLLATCVGPNITECEETLLTPNTEYTRKLTIYSTQSESAYSSLISERTYAQPVSISSTLALNHNEVSLTIDLGNNPVGTNLQIYEENNLKYYDSNLDILIEGEHTFPSTLDPITVSGLDPNTQYVFKVRAVDENSNVTTWSVTSSVRTLAQTPNIVSATALSTTSGRLTIDLLDNSVGTRIAIQEIGGQYVAESGIFDNAEQIFILSGESIDITGLSANSTYTFKVRTYNEDNVASDWSQTTDLITLIEEPTITVSTIDSSSITYDISGLSNLEQGDSAIFIEGVDLWSKETTQTVTGLTPNTLYSTRVKARNSNGVETTYMESESEYTLAVVPSISSTSVISSTEGRVTVNLGNNPDNTRVSIMETVTNQYLSSNGTLVKNEEILTTESKDFTVTGLLANTTYSFKVKAYNEEDIETAYSTEEVSLTPLIQEPTVSVTNITSNSATILISGVNNISQGNSAIFVERLNSWSKNLTQNITGLIANTSYTFRVKARGRYGEETGYVVSEEIRTLANRPKISRVDKTSSNTARIYIDTNGNPSNTKFAIRDRVSQQYLSSNGTLQTQPVWQTYSQWGGVSGRYIAGIEDVRQLGFEIKARNESNVETGFSEAVYIGTGSVILNPPSAISVQLKGDESVNPTTKAQLGVQDIRIRKEEYMIADLKVSFEQDRDWKDVVAEADFSTGKAVVKLTDAHGVTEPFTMYVVKNESNAFRICPEARSLQEVISSCKGGVLASESFPQEINVKGNTVTISEAKIDGTYYWIADGLVGTGGMGELVQQREEVDDEEEVEQEERQSAFTQKVIDRTRKVSKDIVLGANEIFDKTPIGELNERELSTAVATTTTVTITVGALTAGITQSFYIIIHTINGMLSAIGFRRKRKPFGYVYDSTNKEPISNAVVRIFKGDELIETTVTDADGKFLSKLDSGEYRVEVRKGGYKFPSQLIKGSEDYPLQNIYKGEILRKKDSEDLIVNIPLDRKKLSDTTKTMTVLKNLSSIFLTIFNIALFIFGLLLMIYTYYKHPELFRWYVPILYIPAFFFLSQSIFSKRFVYGKVLDSKGNPVSNQELYLIDKEFEEAVAKRVTDGDGKYRFVISKKGEYALRMGSKLIADNINVRRENYILAKRVKLN